MACMYAAAGYQPSLHDHIGRLSCGVPGTLTHQNMISVKVTFINVGSRNILTITQVSWWPRETKPGPVSI